MLLKWYRINNPGYSFVRIFREKATNKKYNAVMKQLEPVEEAHKSDLVSIGLAFNRTKLEWVSVNLSDISTQSTDDIPKTVVVGKKKFPVEIGRVNPETGLHRNAKIEELKFSGFRPTLNK